MPVLRCARHKTRRKWRCGPCLAEFTVTAGTPIAPDPFAVTDVVAGVLPDRGLIPQGMSAVKLGEMLDVSYPTASFPGHRIRAMMAEANSILSAVIEVDEI